MDPPCPRSVGAPFDPVRPMAWVDDHWEAGKLIPARTVNDVVEEWQTGWESDWPEPPLTCSYCGGISAADAMRLIAAGWEIEMTDKSYKAYLHPPGYEEHLNAVMNSIRNHTQYSSRYHSPVPPVKLYTYHFTKEEIHRLNHMIKSNKTAS